MTQFVVSFSFARKLEMMMGRPCTRVSNTWLGPDFPTTTSAALMHSARFVTYPLTSICSAPVGPFARDLDILFQPLVAAADDNCLHGQAPLYEGGQYLLYRTNTFRSEKEKDGEWLLRQAPAAVEAPRGIPCGERSWA